MQELFDKLAATPLVQKVGVLILLLVMLVGGYWYFFYSDLQLKETQLLAHKVELEAEKAQYEQRKAEYLAFRAEKNQLQEEQKELLQALPKDDDMEQFIESIQAQVELSGLTKVSSTRDNAIEMELYKKIPIKMSSVGTYHQVNQFFKSVGDLKRIVNIEDLHLELAPTDAIKDASKVYLKSSFTATTFQYNEKKGPARNASQTISATGGGK